MDIKNFENLSAEYDGALPEGANQGRFAGTDLQTIIMSNFSLLSKLLKNTFNQCQHKEENNFQEFWQQLNTKLDNADNLISTLIQKSLGVLPQKFADLDISEQVLAKLENLDLEKPEETNVTQTKEIQFRNLDIEKILALSLTPSAQSLEEVDLWSKLSATLDEQYHRELFIEPQNTLLKPAENFYRGLNEYLDNRVSSDKANSINQHLSECSNCRKQFSNLVKLRQTIKASFAIDTEGLDLWSDIEQKIFPQKYSIKRVEGF
jgi:hypothetical protein